MVYGLQCLVPFGPLGTTQSSLSDVHSSEEPLPPSEANQGCRHGWATHRSCQAYLQETFNTLHLAHAKEKTSVATASQVLLQYLAKICISYPLRCNAKSLQESSHRPLPVQNRQGSLHHTSVPQINHFLGCTEAM